MFALPWGAAAPQTARLILGGSRPQSGLPPPRPADKNNNKYRPKADYREVSVDRNTATRTQTLK
jgi:hypothetical protein